MNGTEARFMRIKRYSEEEVGVLHDAERKAEGNWMIAGSQALDRLDKQKGAYWPKTTTEQERNLSEQAFLALPVVRRAFASLDNMEVDEMKALHAADWLIYKGTPNPTDSESNKALSAIYQRAA